MMTAAAAVARRCYRVVARREPDGVSSFRIPDTQEPSMTTIRNTAERFFEACETGKGWAGCQQYCHPTASFSAQAAALTGIATLEGYTEWMKGLFGPVPDGRYELRAFAVDEERRNVTAYGVFRGTHSGNGGPVPPTGRSVEADYVYVMEFDGDRIRRMTKIWNDTISLQQLGWG
jgi:predicted ester cyclase